MKFKFRNQLSKDHWQIELLPICGIFSSDKTYCFIIGWLFWVLEFWVGDVDELV